MTSTNRLDHIVHLAPPASVQETSELFRELGFTVLTGGTHEDGLTANALVVFPTGSYFELISFTEPISAYPPGSPERKKRDNHRWAKNQPGWVDYGFLGNGSQTERISDIINTRAAKNGYTNPLYDPEFHGGRKNPDGETLEWLITSANTKSGSEYWKMLPFFCGDITPRRLRVPMDPPSNTQHQNAAVGLAHIRLLALRDSVPAVSRQLTYVVGNEPNLVGSSLGPTYSWDIDTGDDALPCRLILGRPENNEEEEFLKAAVGVPLFEIGFWVKGRPSSDSVMTPYAKIVWVTKEGA
ncbi:glyoxalase-like domain-containing protein [Collybia nuda]|uniref:Glyoxalase-like domain-containing protein n=1 Tax=Collybia nuda TaxID=64659 RepID=A0A9P5XWN3_9AGAR|nr:glyoxalase-like domain-containing protein [Collybia nuda]